MKPRISAIILACLVLSGCLSVPSWIHVDNPLTPVVPTPTPAPTPAPAPAPIPTGPLALGSWGGRPSIALDSAGGVHVVCDGNSSRFLATWDIVDGKVVTGSLDAHDFNPQTQNLFNPSQVILTNDVQLVTCWWFAFEKLEGCNPPYVFYRRPGQPWRSLAVPLFALDWNNAQLCQVSPVRARIFGLQNVWADLEMQGDTLAVVGRGSYSSGSRGGGEKEARCLIAGRMVVANSGCRVNGGSYLRSEVSAPSAVLFAAQPQYPAMGSDDSGHVGCAGDLVNPGIVYVAAYYDALVYNVWSGSQLLFPSDKLPTLDKSWSGLVKYPVPMVPVPGGGAYLLTTAGNTLILRLIHPDGTVSEIATFPGTTGALCISPSGIIHIAYNLNGQIWYRQVERK